nr:hypothetical protein Iba_chr03dCG12730 [Ipomoea batatas]
MCPVRTESVDGMADQQVWVAGVQGDILEGKDRDAKLGLLGSSSTRYRPVGPGPAHGLAWGYSYRPVIRCSTYYDRKTSRSSGIALG